MRILNIKKQTVRNFKLKQPSVFSNESLVRYVAWYNFLKSLMLGPYILFRPTSQVEFFLSTTIFKKKVKRHKLRVRKGRILNPFKIHFRYRSLVKKSSVWGTITTNHIPQKRRKLRVRSRIVRRLRKEFTRLKKRIAPFKKINVIKAWTKIKNNQEKRRIVGGRSRIFLNSKLILNKLNKFLYRSGVVKKHKKKSRASKKYCTFVNLYKKVSWKMRTSRFAHWDLRTRGVLNEYRYNKLIGAELQNKISGIHTQLYYVSRVLLGPLTWKTAEKLLQTGLILFDGKPINKNQPIKAGTIFEFPYGPELPRKKITSDSEWRQRIFKAKKFSYFSYKNKKLFTCIPRVYKKLAFTTTKFKKSLVIDPAVGTALCLETPRMQGAVTVKSLIKTTVLSLNNWRFRFD